MKSILNKVITLKKIYNKYDVSVRITKITDNGVTLTSEQDYPIISLYIGDIACCITGRVLDDFLSQCVEKGMFDLSRGCRIHFSDNMSEVCSKY